MGWSDVYPILTDEMVEEYENKVGVAEREQLGEWFGEADVINRRDLGHVVSVSLFWKNVNCGDSELPTPTREAMQSAKTQGNAKRFDPWTHYVEPLLCGARRLREEREIVTVRVYLAADLNFLIKDLVDAGCEIRLMRHSSFRLAPGLLWRLLAFEDAEDLVTVVDSDLVNRSDAWLDQTERLRETGFKSYRRPRAYASEIDANGYLVYCPVIGSPVGSRLRLPMGQLLRAFIWHARRGSFWTSVIYPGRGEVPIFGTKWPGYGFDEWFMGVTLYPRLAEAGMITDVAAARDGGFFLPMDIEYATWVNPDNCLACPVLPGPEGPNEESVSSF